MPVVRVSVVKAEQGSEKRVVGRLRAYGVELLLVGMLILAVAFFGYLGYGLLSAEEQSTSFSGETALGHVGAQLALGNRVVTSEANQVTRDYVLRELQEMGWAVFRQPYIALVPEAIQTNPNLTVTVAADGAATIMPENVIALKEGAPGAPVALLVTHYDSRIASDLDPDPANHEVPSPGANAGAAGTAVLLELANTLDVAATGHTVCLLFLDGEANRGLPNWDGTFGIDYYLIGMRNDKVDACRDPAFAVVLDMVGNANQQIFVERSGNPELSSALWQTSVALGYTDTIIPEAKWSIPGPQVALSREGVPSVLLSDYDYPYRYTRQDTIDKISPRSLERIGRLLSVWLEQGAPIASN